jgi:hypothetical protein
MNVNAEVMPAFIFPENPSHSDAGYDLPDDLIDFTHFPGQTALDRQPQTAQRKSGEKGRRRI